MRKIALSVEMFALLVILAVGISGCAAGEPTALDNPEDGKKIVTEEPTAIDKPEDVQVVIVEETAAIGDPDNGKLLFELGPEGVYEPTCANCHKLTKLVGFGPGLEGIADTAETRISGLSAVEYLRQSIVDPEAYIVEGNWGDTVMPTIYGVEYSEEDINDLIAFLMTQ